jgi:hypothetical protein
MSHAYRLATLKLASEIELPGLVPWDGSSENRVDLVFRLGPVPRNLEMADHVAPPFQTRGCDAYLLDLPDTGRFLIERGSEITVEPQSGTNPDDIAAVLTGPLQAVLWHQRGLLPLHAVAVVTAGRVIALAGPSGCGKSTLAAALVARGCAILADDVCITRVAEDGASVLPGFPRLRLWRDALDHLGIPVEGLRRVLSDKEKFLVESHDWAVSGPGPLAAIVLPVRVPGARVTIERLRGPGAVAALDANVHMRQPARALGCDAEIFEALTNLVGGSVGIWRLELPDDPAALGVAAAATAGALEG